MTAGDARRGARARAIAVVSVPMGIVALGLGLARARAHKEVARPTAMIWTISAVTGVIFYAMLYLVPA